MNNLLETYIDELENLLRCRDSMESLRNVYAFRGIS